MKYVFSTECPPPPSFPPGIVISGSIACGGTYSGNNEDVPLNDNLPTCGTTELYESPTIWVEFRDESAPQYSSISFDTCVHEFDTEMAVFEVW